MKIDIRQKLRYAIAELPPEACKTLLEQILVRLPDDALEALLIGLAVSADGTVPSGSSIPTYPGEQRSVVRPTRPQDEIGTKKTIRDLIVAALTDRDRALGAADIYHAVSQLKPDVNRPSVDSEIARMRKDGVLCNSERGARGSLYSLAATKRDKLTELSSPETDSRTKSRCILDFLRYRPGASSRLIAQSVYGNSDTKHQARVSSMLSYLKKAKRVRRASDGGWDLTVPACLRCGQTESCRCA